MLVAKDQVSSKINTLASESIQITSPDIHLQKADEDVEHDKLMETGGIEVAPEGTLPKTHVNRELNEI